MFQYLVLGPLVVPMYNLMLGIGLIFAFLVLDEELKQHPLNFSQEVKLYVCLVFCLLAGLAGAKFLDMFYKDTPFTLHNFVYSGITFYGGLGAGIIVLAVWGKLSKINLLFLGNLLVPSVAVAHAWGRVGCFLGGCCFGKPTLSGWGVVYPPGSVPVKFYQEALALYPVQLYEALFLAGLFLVLRKVDFNKRLIIYLVGYGIFRWAIEFLRGDIRGVLVQGAGSPSQLISIGMVSVGVALIVYLKRGKTPSKECSSVIAS